ncbi:cell wall-binding repeat-containing protein [Candidatus Poriferisodalis sp.]|uniref:cell wall-binding repeat-containing protein n=1 Tax=Candidatus Poriferisodalis sp. TaxID=3101277 RepID=UPI003B02B362
MKRLVRSAVLLRRRRTSAETPSQRASRVSGARASFLAVAVLASSFAIASPAASHPSNDHANDSGDPPHVDLSCSELNALPGRPTYTYIVDRGVRFVLSDPNDSTVGPGSNGQYGPGEKVRIEVQYNYHVRFDTRGDLWPRIQTAINGGNVTLTPDSNEVLPTGLEPLSVLFMMGNQMRPAVSVPASGNDRTTLVFEYEVPQGSSSVNGGDVFIPPDSLVANSNSQTERDDYPAQLKSLIDVSLQTISGPCGGADVEHPPVFHPNEAGSPTIVSKPKILSEPANDDTYYLDEQIVLRVEFSEAVAVTGTPLLTFNLGGSTRQARYDRATSSDTRLRFNYTVAANDTTDTNGDGLDIDADGENPEGVSVSRGSLSLSGGTIRAAAVNGRSATLNHDGLDAQVEFLASQGGDPTVPKHLVNGVTDTTDYALLYQPAHVFSYSTRIVSEPAKGDRYYTGEEIIVRVDFSEAVSVAPGDVPSLSIDFCCENFRGETIDKNTVQADYYEGSGNTRLRFKYEIKTGDADADGVVVPGGNFDTTNGTITATDGGSIYLHYSDVFEKPQPMHKIDGINVPGDPEVDGLPRIVSDPNNDGRDGTDNTYKSGDVIEVGISFTQGVTVNVVGDGPKLTLRVGANDRDAFYVRGDGSSEVVFAYTVIDGEEDGGGVSVPAGTIDENGGSIIAFDDLEPAGLSYGTLSDQSGHKVDAVAPTLSSFYIASDPPNNGDTYGAGQIIEIAAVFDEPVTAASGAYLVVNLDNNASGLAYLPTDYDDTQANSTVIFEYEVRSGDLDTDGVSLADDALSATISDVAGNETTSFADADNLEDLDDDINHKVDTVAPQIVTDGMEVTSTPPGGDGVFRRGEIITVTVTFDEVVYVDQTDGTPAVEIGPGSDTKYATYATGDGTETLTFTYAVEADDHDGSNGNVTLSIGSNIVYANDKTIYDSQNDVDITYGLITDKPGNRANLDHSSPQIPDDRDEVNGSLEPLGPYVTAIDITSNPGVDMYYKDGDTITVRLTFSSGVTVSGSPQLALGIDSTTGDGIAAYSRTTGGNQLYFNYSVDADTSDEDHDGISIAGTALSLPSGVSIVQTSDSTKNAVLGLTAQNNLSGHKVDAISPTVTDGPRFTTFPTTDNTWAAGQEIKLEVDFSEDVVVTSGTPYVPLTIGNRTRNAEWVEPSGYDPTDPTFAQNSLVFSYTVQSDDGDNDGISIAEDGLSGTIKDFAGNTANLDHDAVADDDQHKVDTAAPSATSLTVVSNPNDDGRTGDDDTYAIDDYIDIDVTFSEDVFIDSSVADADTAALRIQIGSNSPSATYDSQTNTFTLRFRYEVGSVEGDVDLDTNGISIAANQLTLPTGFATDSHGNDATTTHLALGTQTGHKVDGVRPTVTKMEITSTPPNGGMHYGDGETVVVQVTFSEVVVPSSPSLLLDIGGSQRHTQYVAPVGATTDQAFRTLDFHYVVGSGDTTVTADTSDTEGVAVADDPLFASSIQDAVGNDASVDDDDSDPELAPQSRHQVETVQPAVSEVVVSSSAEDGTYRYGDMILITVTFQEAGVDENVYVKTTDSNGDTVLPTMGITIGGASKQATYTSGHGSAELVFAYTVQGDGPGAGADDSGTIVIPSGSIALNGAEITDRSGNDALLALNGIGTTSDTVDGSLLPLGPHIAAASDVNITSDPGTDGAYKVGDLITVGITFSEAVRVSRGPPQLTLDFDGIDSEDGVADCATGNVGTTLTCSYQVAAGDVDTNGIDIDTDALSFNGGTIVATAADMTPAVLLLPMVPTFTDQRVDGIAPTITSVLINSRPTSDDTYGIGQTVEVDVTFDELVVITGTPRIGLTIGTATKQAEYVENPDDIQNFNSADGVYTVRFEYTISSGDTDADGIGIAANALRNISGSTIKDLVGNPANLDHDAVVDDAVNPSHKVNTSAPSIDTVTVTSQSGLHKTYGPDSGYHTIEITVTFDELIEVTGNSSTLTIQVGSGSQGERTATFSRNTGSEAVYQYAVVADDLDTDGISIGANALELNGDTITDRTNNAADVSNTTLGTQADHKVDGVGPTATKVTINTSPPNDGDHYGAGEMIEVIVEFNEDIATPTGTPQITLIVGTEEVAADYSLPIGPRGLSFTYTVQVGNADTDGIDVKADSLNGTITDFAENDAATTIPPIAGDRSGHKVETDPPEITLAQISSTAPAGQGPPGNGYYRLGEIITVTVTYDEAVYVTTGDSAMNDTGPQLDLAVGTNTRQATYTSGSGSAELVFAYTVVAADTDDDGIEFNDGSINLGGGTITDRAGNDAHLSYTGQGHESDHKVDGSEAPLGPTVQGSPVISSSPQSESTYFRTERIQITLNWSTEVTVTGKPQLEIRVGDVIKNAVYSAGTGTKALTFSYTVKSGDTDTNGVSVMVNSLALNSGTVKGTSDQKVALLNHLGVPDAGGHRVDGSRLPVPYITDVAITSDPDSNSGAYGQDDDIEIEVGWSEEVFVSGTPQIAIVIGSVTRQARFVSGSTSDLLLFRYRVRSGDEDNNGISLPANRLTGGTIRDDDNDSADRRYAAIEDDPNQQVDTSKPRITDMEIISTPRRDDTYEREEIVRLEIEFDEPVNVDQTPKVNLQIGASDRVAVCDEAPSDENKIVCTYTVRPGDSDTNGVSVRRGAVDLRTGSITDLSGNSVNATHSGLRNQTDHKVDGGEANVRLRRIWGADRFETAAEIAEEYRDETADQGSSTRSTRGVIDTVIITSGRAFPDALSAAALAGSQRAPILLTEPNFLSKPVSDFIKSHSISRVYIVGGTAAVAQRVENSIDDLTSVRQIIRLGGRDRYETSVLVSQAVGGAGTFCGTTRRTVLLATGEDFADALSFAPIAAIGPHPLLLTERDSLPANVRKYLVDGHEDGFIDRVLVAGGTAAISNDVTAELTSLGLSPVRIGGRDRFDTAVRLAEYALGGGTPGEGTCLDNDQVGLAVAWNFADGLAAGPLLALVRGPTILLPTDPPVPSVVRRFLSGAELDREMLTLIAMGGPAALSDEVLNAARDEAARAD